MYEKTASVTSTRSTANKMTGREGIGSRPHCTRVSAVDFKLGTVVVLTFKIIGSTVVSLFINFRSFSFSLRNYRFSSPLSSRP